MDIKKTALATTESIAYKRIKKVHITISTRNLILCNTTQKYLRHKRGLKLIYYPFGQSNYHQKFNSSRGHERPMKFHKILFHRSGCGSGRIRRTSKQTMHIIPKTSGSNYLQRNYSFLCLFLASKSPKVKLGCDYIPLFSIGAISKKEEMK